MGAGQNVPGEGKHDHGISSHAVCVRRCVAEALAERRKQRVGRPDITDRAVGIPLPMRNVKQVR